MTGCEQFSGDTPQMCMFSVSLVVCFSTAPSQLTLSQHIHSQPSHTRIKHIRSQSAIQHFIHHRWFRSLVGFGWREWFGCFVFPWLGGSAGLGWEVLCLVVCYVIDLLVCHVIDLHSVQKGAPSWKAGLYRACENPNRSTPQMNSSTRKTQIQPQHTGMEWRDAMW